MTNKSMTNKSIANLGDQRTGFETDWRVSSKIIRVSACAMMVSFGITSFARAEVCSNYSGLSGITIKGTLDRAGIGQLDLKPGRYQFQFSGGSAADVGQFNVTVTMNGRVLMSGRIGKNAGSLTCGPPLSFTVPAGMPAPVAIHLRKVGDAGRP